VDSLSFGLVFGCLFAYFAACSAAFLAARLARKITSAQPLLQPNIIARKALFWEGTRRKIGAKPAR
jgi:hypothetical protein